MLIDYNITFLVGKINYYSTKSTALLHHIIITLNDYIILQGIPDINLVFLDHSPGKILSSKVRHAVLIRISHT